MLSDFIRPGVVKSDQFQDRWWGKLLIPRQQHRQWYSKRTQTYQNHFNKCSPRLVFPMDLYTFRWCFAPSPQGLGCMCHGSAESHAEGERREYEWVGESSWKSVLKVDGQLFCLSFEQKRKTHILEQKAKKTKSIAGIASIQEHGISDGRVIETPHPYPAKSALDQTRSAVLCFFWTKLCHFGKACK